MSCPFAKGRAAGFEWLLNWLIVHTWRVCQFLSLWETSTPLVLCYTYILGYLFIEIDFTVKQDILCWGL